MFQLANDLVHHFPILYLLSWDSNDQLSSLVRDDLGRCLILLCSRRGLPPAVLQSALGLFCLTVQLLGPTTRILIECFMRYIYIKAILQVRVLFASHDESMRLMSEPQTSKENATGNTQLQSLMSTSNSSTSFTVGELEIILESLADLLADLGFLPSLFASFDCDPSKGDIVQPMIKYLSSCMRYTMVCESSELSMLGLQEIGALIEQCYTQISFTMSQREELKTINITSTMNKSSHRNDVNNLIESFDKQSVDTNQIDSSLSHRNKNNDNNNVEYNGNSTDWTELAEKLRLTRLAKGILAEAAIKFSCKPQEGLKFLQKKGILPIPLTPSSVAKFLRIAPGLPNECTGAFLGELGKDNPSYEADGKAFHRSVLLSYVRSFELKGQTVLNCMRIFLSAFRLPGEAQQIDRILVAFSEYCHDGSIEGKNGILENPEVTYLLTFSMIMLNTDLHNPNVRADRKMTIAQFIKNNSFYGEELNQTRNIPKEYLEEVYESLSLVPLRTERNDLNASITPEMWMDLQLQAAITIEKGLMLCTSYSSKMLQNMSKKKKNNSDGLTSVITSDVNKTISTPTEGHVADTEENNHVINPVINNDVNEIANVARHLLNEDVTVEKKGILELCESLHGFHWILDQDLLSCVSNDLFGVAISPFVMHRYLVAPTLATVAPRATSVSYTSDHGSVGDNAQGNVQVVETNHWRVRHASVRALSSGIELSLELLSLLHSNGMQTALDAFILLLVDIAGVSIKVEASYSFFPVIISNYHSYCHSYLHFCHFYYHLSTVYINMVCVTLKN